MSTPFFALRKPTLPNGMPDTSQGAPQDYSAAISNGPSDPTIPEQTRYSPAIAGTMPAPQQSAAAPVSSPVDEASAYRAALGSAPTFQRKPLGIGKGLAAAFLGPNWANTQNGVRDFQDAQAQYQEKLAPLAAAVSMNANQAKAQMDRADNAAKASQYDMVDIPIAGQTQPLQVPRNQVGKVMSVVAKQDSANTPPHTVDTGDGVFQYNPDTSRYDIKVGASKSANKPDTSAQDDQHYEQVKQNQALGKQISPEDAAFTRAYEARKTLGPNASSAAADRRQQQSENFSQQETGRKYLSEKVEGPYQDAAEKADMLRSVVHAAQSGNMIAGSLQPLLATLGVTTMEGVKRINSTELAQVSGAGDLLTRIKGQVGKLKEGQPLPPNLQNDIVGLADTLQKSAHQKYLDNFQRTTQRYGLNDETPIPGPASPNGGGKSSGALSLDEAKSYLQKAGGDKNKARLLAKQDGRTF